MPEKTEQTKLKSASFAPKVELPATTQSRSYRLSYVIGSVAAIASCILMAWVVFFQSDNNIAIELSSVSATPDGRLELQGLTYKGKTESGDPYIFNAKRAAEDATNANLVHLTKIDGEITNAKNGQITLSSDMGRYDQTQNFVTLEGDVIIIQKLRQLTFSTSRLSGDLTHGHFDAPEAVDLKSPTSHIVAEAMAVTDFGDRIVFKGQSTAIIGGDDKS